MKTESFKLGEKDKEKFLILKIVQDIVMRHEQALE